MSDVKYCPFCLAEAKHWITEKETIEINIKEALKHKKVINVGIIENHAKYWFSITKFKCMNCGESFWIQDTTK